MYSSPFSARNLLTQITYPNGSIVDRTFTARAQLQQTSYNTNMVATLQYDPGMRESQRTMGNNIVTTRSYQRDDNLVTAINTAADAALSFAYTYDANKNPTSETTGGVMANYSWNTSGGTGGYDNEDRLVNWQRSGGGFTQVWNLSLVGDWNINTINGNAETRTHNDVHEILTVTPGNPQTTLLHDAKGNLSRDEKNQTYTWDYNNHQSQAVNTAAETWSYTYDALGRRVSKSITITNKTDTGGVGSVSIGTTTTTTTTTTVYVCLSQTVQGKPCGQEIAEYNANSAPANALRMYVFGSYVDEPLALITPQGLGYTTHYYHQNRQYCVTAMTDNLGGVIERYAYTAYGVTTILAPDGLTPRTSSLIANSYLYTGRRLDGETGNYYFRARYHSPTLGRFIGRDPLGYPDGYNAYVAYFIPWGGDPLGQAPGDYETNKALGYSDREIRAAASAGYNPGDPGWARVQSEQQQRQAAQTAEAAAALRNEQQSSANALYKSRTLLREGPRYENPNFMKEISDSVTKGVNPLQEETIVGPKSCPAGEVLGLLYAYFLETPRTLQYAATSNKPPGQIKRTGPGEYELQPNPSAIGVKVLASDWELVYVEVGYGCLPCNCKPSHTEETSAPAQLFQNHWRSSTTYYTSRGQ